MKCCSNQTSKTSVDMNCPNCNHSGKIVTFETVSGFRGKTVTHKDSNNYHICNSPDCNVVYYENELKEIILTSKDLRKFYPKCTDLDSYLCHCFEYTVLDFKNEGKSYKDSDIVKTINQKIKDKLCQCELKNPHGKCCLGSISTYFKSQ